MKLIHWLVTAPLALILILFAVSNRTDVTLYFWPLPVALNAPLWLVVLVALLIGFLVGELVAWINGHHWRRQARQKSRRIEELERQLAAPETNKQTPKEAARDLALR
jgi:uncharacterized integral membrane protein